MTDADKVSVATGISGMAQYLTRKMEVQILLS
jgi:hypothetical protein